MRELSNDDTKLVRSFAMKDDKKEDFFHSSSYATAQNGQNIGTASVGLTMEERKAIEEKRKFVQNYNESNLVGKTYSLRHSKQYVPPKNDGPRVTGGAPNRGNVVGIGGKNGDLGGNHYSPFKTGSSPAPSAPSAASRFMSGINPSFK
jgi:hypothetical protein